MLRRTPIAALVAAAATCAVSFPHVAEATVVKLMTLEEKCRVAPLIVFGAVERVESEWDDEGGIRTLITFRVEETLKGEQAKGSRILVYRGGGQIGEVRQEAAGMSRYEAGEEAVLFLEPIGPYLVELGIGIGKYEVAPSGGEKWVTHAPKVAGARFTTGRAMSIEPIPPMEPMRLSRFFKVVRSHVAGIPVDPPLLRKGTPAETAMPEEPAR